MLVDSHCHLDFPDFADDLDGVVQRATAAGVGRMVTISTRLDRFDGVLAIAERFPQVYCTVGVHPHEADVDWGRDARRLIDLAGHPKVVGIGETGLDYYYEHASREGQATSFRAHIAAARATGLPLIVHTRDADTDTMAMLAEGHRDGPFPGLIHCFSGDQKLADFAVDLGLYISFSGIVTFKKADTLRAVAARVPADRLLVETDAPYLAPVPHRGKRNEPGYVTHTAQEIARARGVTVEEITVTTTSNFFSLFTKCRIDHTADVGRAA
jgi:TatD DNase family protein